MRQTFYQSTLDQQFAEFHRANPDVYAELVRMAREAQAAGRRAIGIKMLWEVLRWNAIRTGTGVEKQLNNNYPSRYARLIMATEVDLAGIFETRELRS